MRSGSRYVFREPTARPRDGARYRREAGPDGMITERDVPVPVRGGVTVYADVFHSVNRGPHVIWADGDYDSHLLVPMYTP